MRTASGKALFRLGANGRKPWHIVRTGRAAVVAALLLGLFLPGWTSMAGAQSKGSAPSARTDNPGHVKFAWLRIMAFTDAPLVGADVRVYLHSQPWPSIDVPAATNNQGVFSVAVRSSLFRSRARVRVTVSGGTTNGNVFPWYLSADVVLADPAHQIVVVNPVTTLVSILLDARPDLKLDSAQALVRHFLGLPAGYSLGLALRESSGYASPFFSPAALLAQAEAAGGLDGLEAGLLQELLASPSATHSFLNPNPKGLATDAIEFIAKNAAAGIIAYGAGHGVGWAIQATGLIPEQGATADDISELQQGLTDLQSSVDALSSQVAQLTLLVQSTATQTQYNTIVVPASNLAAQVTAVQNRLQFFTQQCPPLPDGSTPQTPSSYCTTEKAGIIAELNDVTIYSAYEVLVTEVQDNPTIGFRGMLHLYSLWLAQSKAFFRPADSTKMQDLYDYWDAALTEAANLKVELLHWEGEQDAGAIQLIALMGNPDLIPPTTGTFQANRDANLKLMFPPVPFDTAISTGDHTMWSLVPWSRETYQQSTYYPARSCYTNATNSPLASSALVQGYAGFNDWRGQPTLAMWQAAVSRVPTTEGWVYWAGWLRNETLANAPESPTSGGFFSCELGVSYNWTSTMKPSTNYYYLISLFQDRYDILAPANSVYGNYNYPVRTLLPGEQYFWYQ